MSRSLIEPWLNLCLFSRDFNTKVGDGNTKVSDELLEGVIKFTVPVSILNYIIMYA